MREWVADLRVKRAFGMVALTVAALVVVSARAVETRFPFESRLLLDVDPMKGSKRVPMLQIGPEGETSIDLWCNSLPAQLVVVKDTLTIMAGQKTDRQCPPERMQADDDILDALTQVTTWRRDGDVVIFEGAKPLRFRLPTN